MKDGERMFALDEADGLAHDTESNEVVVLFRSGRDGHDLAAALIEDLGRGRDRAVAVELKLAEQSLGAGRIDIEAEDSAPKCWDHGDAGGPDDGADRIVSGVTGNSN